MIFPSEILVKLAIKAAIAAAIAGFLFFGYEKIKSIGYQEAEQKYTKVIKDYEDNLNKKIDNIETLAGTLVVENRENNVLLTNDINTILTRVKTKPLTIVKNGECSPSQTFSDTFVEINKRANQSMKDSQK